MMELAAGHQQPGQLVQHVQSQALQMPLMAQQVAQVQQVQPIQHVQQQQQQQQQAAPSPSTAPTTPVSAAAAAVAAATAASAPGAAADVAPKKARRNKKAPTKSKMVTGYIIYASEIRKEIIKKNKDKTFGEISKIVGEEWKQLSQENKVAYEKRAQEQNSLFKMEFAAETALELSKLADVAAAQAANEEKQQQEEHNQQQQQQQHLLQQHHQLHHQQHQQQPVNQQPPQPALSQQQQQQLSHQFEFNQQQQQQLSHHFEFNQQQQQQLSHQFEFNQYDQHQSLMPLNMQQQQQPTPQQQQTQQQTQQQQQQQPPQPFQIIQHQVQTPISTMMQYCTNPACSCPNSDRYQPYAYPYSPPAQPSTPTALQQHQQLQQQVYSPAQLSPSHRQYPYKRNNIIYRKPIIIKLRPRDASTQTDPIKWVEKTEQEVAASVEKKPLRYSQKFIDHLICATSSPTKSRPESR